jgi:hypothetical protein
MDCEYGKTMARAMQAVRDMHSDCIQLFRDVDREMKDYKSVYGNVVTQDLGSSITRRDYLAWGLFRVYARKGKEDKVLSINACFFDDKDPRIVEPIFAVAKVEYSTKTPDPKEKLDRAWDPWYAFFAWSQEQEFGKAIHIEAPARAQVVRATVAAMPLFSISNLNAALHLADLVGRP